MSLQALYINGTRSSNGLSAHVERENRLLSDVCIPLDIECSRTQAVYVDETFSYCKGSDFNKKHRNDRHVKGLSQAHRIALEKVSSGKYGDKVIIFEDDVVLPVKDAEKVKTMVHDYVARMDDDTDIAYLGNCHGKLCSHAYVTTTEAAKKILRHGLDDGQEATFCNTPIDKMIRQQCLSNSQEEGHLNCTYPKNISANLKVKTDNQSGLIYQGLETLLGSVKLTPDGNHLKNKDSVDFNSLYVDKPADW